MKEPELPKAAKLALLVAGDLVKAEILTLNLSTIHMEIPGCPTTSYVQKLTNRP